MKKLKLLMILCLFCIATAKADNEPGNNTPGTTTDVLALGGASQTGSVTPTTDNDDYFKIITTAEGDITINIATGNGNLVYFYLYDNDGTTQLGGAYLYGGSNAFTANGLSAGTYFVRVNLSGAGTNTYTLSGTLTPRTYANDIEPNDVYTNASTIALNGTATGHITHRYNGGIYDTDDWYKVITNADGNLAINITTENGNLVYFSLYDNDGTTTIVGGNYLYGGSSSFTANGLAAGTYYILIHQGSNVNYNSYTLSNTLTPSLFANDAEPNNIYTSANTIAVNDSAKGHITHRYNGGTYDTEDWYKLITNSDGNITISIRTINGNLVYFNLYDNDGITSLGGNYLYGGSASFIVNGRAAGTYYIKITQGSNVSYNSYVISDSLTTPLYSPDVEPNGFALNAVSFPMNSTTQGQISHIKNGGAYDTDDWYKIVTNDDGDVSLNITTENGNLVYFALYDSDTATNLVASYLFGGSSSITKTGLAAGTYYARIQYGLGNTFNSYSLSNSLSPATYANDAEPNGSFATAVLLNNRPQKTGHISYRYNGNTYDQDDYHIVRMYTAGSCSFDITVANGNLVYFYFYNPAQGLLYSTYIYGGTANFSFPSLAAGDYYLRVGFGGPTYNSYNITNFSVPCNPAAAVIAASGNTTFCAPGSVTLNTQSTSEYASYLWSNNATSSSIAVSSSGTFTVTATDYDGCPHASNSITVNSVAAPTPSITAGGATTFCQGGSVSLNAGAGFSSYAWSTGATTQSINVSLSGTFTVTVTNANGCSGTSSPASVTVNPLPTATISAGGATTFCAGGSVTLTSSAATSYLWSTGATTQAITVNATGNYSVTVKNANNCSATSAATSVTVNPLPATPTIQAGGLITFCAGGSVTLTSSTATSYLWSTGATTQAITVNATGNYSVTVKNANNCSAISVATSVTVNPLPTVALSPFTAVCSTDAAFTLTGGSPAGGTYSGTGVSGGQFNPTTAGVGTFTITYSYTNANNCTATAQQAITVNNCGGCTPTISTGGGAITFCQGGSVTLTSSAAASYLWSTGATTQSITVTSTGNYSVTTTNASNCTATSAVTSVTVNPLPATPTIQAGGAITFCAGGSVTLTSSAATSYLWSTGATTQAITVNATGNYSVTVKNANNCSATSAATSVTVNPLPATPTIQAGGAITFCAGGSVTLTSSAATSYLWSTGATTQAITVNATGNYSVTVKNANNCSATSAATSVTVNPLPTVTLSPFTAVCSTDAAFTLSGGSPAGGTYSGTGVNGGQFNPATAGVGTFTITYSYTNANNCTATAQQSITVNNCGGCTPTISADKSTTFCQGGSVTLMSSAAATYLWSTGATTQSITVNSSGSYTVTTTNANNCTGTSSPLVVTVNPLPAIPTISAGGPTTLCQGESVTLTSSSLTNNVWSTGATTQSITVTTAGNYTVRVTNSSNCSSISTATIVIVNPLPAIPTISAGGPTTFCRGGSVTLTSSSATNNLWSTGATTQAITVTAAGNYTVKVTNANNCSSTSAATTVIVNNCNGVYCAANGNSKNKGYIANVFLRTIFNTTGWNAGGYGDYTNQSTTLNRRYDYVISVTPGYTNSFLNAAALYTRVWIDWNQDGDFNDPGELAFAPSGPSYFLRLGIINVPNNALNGATRMRVAMGAGTAPTNCGSFAYGEVEDYTVVVGTGNWYKGEEQANEPAVTLNETFNLYPNPVSEELTIQRLSNDNSKVVATSTAMQIADANGRVVLKSNLTRSTETIDVRRLPSGIYFVQLKTNNSITTKKIVISH